MSEKMITCLWFDQRAMNAMMTMRKIDIAAIEAARAKQ
jgi:predicted 3-demethylubiquinone-9 3-methyltransferase (glyoxalase superfamily)